MDKHRAHIRVRDFHLHKGLAEVFTPDRHSAKFLAEKVIRFSKLRGEELGRLQKLAIHRFHQDAIFDLRTEIPGLPDRAVMMAYYQFFDELFFFGSLGGSKRFILDVDFSRSEDDAQQPFEFSERTLLNAQDGIWSQVYELLIVRQTGDTRHKRLRAALSLLLQGMCHGFLALWQCKSDQCSEMWSEEGSGRAWQDMAMAIEDATYDAEFLDLNIPLERLKMLAGALKVHSAKLKKNQLWEWGLEPKRLAKELSRITDEKSA